MKALPSSLGVFLTLIVLFLMTGYIVHKTNIWITKDETEIISINKELHYDSDYVMDTSKGMFFALAFTGFDNV